MWGWIGTVVDSVVDTIGETDWTSTLSSSITSSVIGAGVGALASAVTDKSISEGLLYGAAGGLVTGGLLEFGSQFADNWSLASSGYDGGLVADSGDSYSNTMSSSGFSDMDLKELTSAGVKDAVATGSTVSLDPKTGGSWWEKAGNMLTTEGGAQLALGGVSMLGNLLDDSDTQVDVANRQLDQADSAKANQVSGLSGFSASTGDYVPTTSVSEVIRDKNIFDKSASGVNLG